ncbi:N-acetyl-D-Glu racemase DgcA [Sphingomonas montana]|uniref:N-acetyl-D-Glu racemase DgcA n=1 Tax=Sphingomonas montana TaxID=1843236 RepID=UPI00096F1E6A|nr:N-acetyl-D-Glu racemase DgcA [Sphingomonas montana]
MRRSLTITPHSFALARPFRISRGTKSAADVVHVVIGENGVAGRGEGVPYPRYGESVGGAIAAIEAVRAAIEAGAGRDAIAALMPAGAARNAVDCALWDLEARLAGRRVAELAEVPAPGRMATALTVGLDTPDAMAAAAALLAHVPLLKVKVDAADPAAQVRAVRRAAPGPRLIVDPNESWTIAVLDRMQDVLAEARVALLEQPLPAEADDALVGYAGAVPIAADEALHGVDDLDRIAGRYGVVNIKLDKTGGLTAALALADAARARGLGVMTGCMICSSLSIAPALLIAGRSAFVDLDGPFWLSHDLDGGGTEDGGMLVPPGEGFWG